MWIRTLKSAIAVITAIYLANRLNLDTYTFAGIAAILAIHATRKESIKVTGKLFLAAHISLFIGCMLFYFLNFEIYVIGLTLLIVIPLLIWAKVDRGIVISSVVTIHLFSAGTVTFSFITNEILLITIGMGISLLVNLIYMPTMKKELGQIRMELDKQYAALFNHLANHLQQENYIWDGAEILAIDQLIKKGKEISLHDIENYVSKRELAQYHYFEIQEKKSENIQRILPLLSRVDQVLVQGIMLASMFEKIELKYKQHKQADISALYGNIRLLRKEYEEMELPATRHEFEIRAALLHILNELEIFVLENTLSLYDLLERDI